MTKQGGAPTPLTIVDCLEFCKQINIQYNSTLVQMTLSFVASKYAEVIDETCTNMSCVRRVGSA